MRMEGYSVFRHYILRLRICLTLELTQLYGISGLCLVLERVCIIYIYVLLSEQRGIYKVTMHSPELIGQ